jgi:hypothetical protein
MAPWNTASPTESSSPAAFRAIGVFLAGTDHIPDAGS